MNTIDRYRGCLLGLAAGDALGTTLEFKPPGTFTLHTDIIGGGPFKLKPGQWTDDTSLALCLAESLIECQKLDPVDQLERYLQWRDHGHLSSNGRCFDMGRATEAALKRFQETEEPYCGSSDNLTAGNGSIMRLAPVPMFFARQPQLAIEKASESSRTTHAAIQAVDACRYFSGLIVGALSGVSKKELLSPEYVPITGYWKQVPLIAPIAEIAAGSFKHREPPEIIGTGYVVKSLEAALWAFHKSTNYHDGALLAVNLGYDADTTGAVYGQLAGAYYGKLSIPAAWVQKLAFSELIQTMADRLYTLSSTI